jgi:hypothetical protein
MEVVMAFAKKSIGMTRPVAVHLEDKPAVSVPGSKEIPSLGEERGGKVWDGDKWVPKSEWEAAQASR